jgi:hypothetical protein
MDMKRFHGGRPLRADGRTIVAPLEPGSGWVDGRVRAADLDVEALPPEARVALAEAWRQDAQAEHASVAAFARATLELMAVGAPPDLVEATQRASLEEIEHARICFDLASAYGTPVSAGELPALELRGLDVAGLAVAVFEEGCAAETVSALVADVGAGSCEIEVVRTRLQQIAADESDHAALAWQTVAWLVRRGGAPVIAALRTAATDLEARLVVGEDDPSAPAPSPWLRRHGRLDAAAQRALQRQAWRELVAPLLERMCADEEAASPHDFAL